MIKVKEISRQCRLHNWLVERELWPIHQTVCSLAKEELCSEWYN